jgi:osmoprotectant transport system permease protein
VSRARFIARLVVTPIAIVVALVLIYVLVGDQTNPNAVAALTDDADAKVAHAYDDRVTLALLQHLRLIGISAVAVLAIGIPLGVLLTRTRSKIASGVLAGLFTAGQAMPVIGVLVLLVAFFGLKVWVPYVGLVLYAVLPVMRNTVEGIRNVDPALIDAARGQGFSSRQVLTRVELPLAVPIILSGVRTALVLLVGTATIATFVGGKGLGDIIDSGIANQRDAVLMTGAGLAAVLAVAVDWIAGLAERRLSPKGLRTEPSA